MNYVVLNYPEVFKDNINLRNFKEVGLFGEERADGVFGCITKDLLETIDILADGRDPVFPGSELLRDATIFVLLKIDRDILLDEDTKFIETLFGFLDQESFFVEILHSLNKQFNVVFCDKYAQFRHIFVKFAFDILFIDN